MAEELKEFDFNFDVVHTYSKIIKATNLAEAMQEFKKWYQNVSDLTGMEILDEEIYQINTVWSLDSDGEHEPSWNDCFEWGTVVPVGGCTVENFEWIERK